MHGAHFIRMVSERTKTLLWDVRLTRARHGHVTKLGVSPHNGPWFNPSWQKKVAGHWPEFRAKWAGVLSPEELAAGDKIISNFQWIQVELDTDIYGVRTELLREANFRATKRLNKLLTAELSLLQSPASASHQRGSRGGPEGVQRGSTVHRSSASAPHPGGSLAPGAEFPEAQSPESRGSLEGVQRVSRGGPEGF
eukprot:1182276-Prorocentrum_minimum.AAC.2